MEKPTNKPTTNQGKDFVFTLATEPQKQEHFVHCCKLCVNYCYCKQKDLGAYLWSHNFFITHNAICFLQKAFNQAYYFAVHAELNTSLTAEAALEDAFLSYLSPLNHIFKNAKCECENCKDAYTWELAKTFLREHLEQAHCFKAFILEYGNELFK